MWPFKKPEVVEEPPVVELLDLTEEEQRDIVNGFINILNRYKLAGMALIINHSNTPTKIYFNKLNSTSPIRDAIKMDGAIVRLRHIAVKEWENLIEDVPFPVESKWEKDIESDN